jgi:hypothetical protein
VSTVWATNRAVISRSSVATGQRSSRHSLGARYPDDLETRSRHRSSKVVDRRRALVELNRDFCLIQVDATLITPGVAFSAFVTALVHPPQIIPFTFNTSVLM